MSTSMPMQIPSPWQPSQMNEFLEYYFYSPEAFLISEVLSANPEAGEIQARSQANTNWLVAPYQKGPSQWHPRHVSGGDLIMLTASLGCLHAYFFHSCLWQEGWVGFGSRIENAEFHNLARVDADLELYSKEIRVRRGSKRTLITFEFRFTQQDKIIYSSKQTALFVCGNRPEKDPV